MPWIKQIGNDHQQYGWLSIFFHWLMALTILAMYPLGLYIVSLGYYDPGYQVWPNVHRSIGVLLGMLLLLRLAWRWYQPNPIMLASGWEKFAARAGHTLLYLLLAVVVVSGYLMSTADGRAVQVFDWFSVPAVSWLAQRQEELWGAVHFYSATTLISLAGLHALAAFKHHFFERDRTLVRMLGRQSQLKESNHD